MAHTTALDDRALAVRLLDRQHCPDCGTTLASAHCGSCGMELTGPTAARLAAVSERAAELLHERADLRMALRQQVQPRGQTPPGVGTMRPLAEPIPQGTHRAEAAAGHTRTHDASRTGGAPAPAAYAATRHSEARNSEARNSEATAATAQKALVFLGATLLAIAAFVFTVVAWGDLGIAGRTAVLVAVTATAGIAAHLCGRRGLRSTGEALAALTAALLVLDAWAARSTGLADLDEVSSSAYWGVLLSTTGITALMVSRWATLQATPVAAALATGVAPLALFAYVVGYDAAGAAVLVASAGVLGLLALADRTVPCTSARRILAAAAVLWGVTGSLTAFGTALAEPDAAAASAGVLVLAAGGAALAGRVAGRRWSGVGSTAYAAAGLALIAAVVGPSAHVVEAHWLPLIGAVLALAALGMAGLQRSVQLRRGLHGTAFAAGLLTGVVPACFVVLAASAPLVVLERGSATASSATTDAWSLLEVGKESSQGAAFASVCTLLVLGGLLLLAGRGGIEVLRRSATGGGAALLGAAVVTLPLAAELPVSVAALALVVLGAGAALLAGQREQTALAAVAAAVMLIGLGWALTSSALLLASLLVVLAAAATSLASWPERWRPVAAGVGCAAAVAAAYELGLVLDLDTPWSAVLAVTVAGAGLVAAYLLPGPSRATVEVTGALLTLLALTAAAEAELARSVALTLAGAAAAAVALRPDRRRVRWLALALLTLASWSRLEGAQVEVLEAYTVPTALALLVLRGLAARDGRSSSWVAYLPGLGLGLLPSLLQVVNDPQGPVLRALLLAGASAVVTVLGARLQLAAPLVLGGTVLLVDALVQTGPVVAALPRWVVVGLLGASLLAVGATYEQRLAQVRAIGGRLQRLG